MYGVASTDMNSVCNEPVAGKWRKSDISTIDCWRCVLNTEPVSTVSQSSSEVLGEQTFVISLFGKCLELESGDWFLYDQSINTCNKVLLDEV